MFGGLAVEAPGGLWGLKTHALCSDEDRVGKRKVDWGRSCEGDGVNAQKCDTVK